MADINKIVIPAAGFGTRFLPATKAQPKEMLPILDKPTIQYIVEEAVAAGIETVIMVISQNKNSIEDHFDRNPQLEQHLEESGKPEIRTKLRQISEMADFIFIRQKGPYGNGTPVLNAKPVIGDEPFAVIWGDDLVKSEKPRLTQLLEVYRRYRNPVLTAYQVSDEQTRDYGIIDGEQIEPGVLKVKSIVEKPGPGKAPSRIASIGGYILTPDIFEALEKTPPGKDNELWLVDAIFNLAQRIPLYACLIQGEHHDVGSKLGWLKANIKYGLRNEEIGPELKNYLKELVKEL